MSHRTFVIRHLTRDKQNEQDPQTPTESGEIETHAMGMLVRRKYDPHFKKCRSSPQKRGTRTAKLFLKAVQGLGDDQMPEIETNVRLNDFSTDTRFTDHIKTAMKGVKGKIACESEPAVLISGAADELVLAKLGEAVNVVDETNDYDGDVLIGGIHGLTVDMLFAHYARKLNPTLPLGFGAFGRQIKKCEGFVLSYDDAGKLTGIEKIERPAWLNAVDALIGAED